MLLFAVAVNGGWWDDITDFVEDAADTVADTVSKVVHHFRPNVFGFDKADNYAALEKAHADNKDLYRVSEYPASIEVEWTQHSDWIRHSGCRNCRRNCRGRHRRIRLLRSSRRLRRTFPATPRLKKLLCHLVEILLI